MEAFSKQWDQTGSRFEQWRRKNPEYYVINCKTAKDMMLHKAHCPHFDFNRKVNLSKRKKQCSADRQELERWARRQTDQKLKVCKTCL